jgi:signal transduction histidine kinase
MPSPRATSQTAVRPPRQLPPWLWDVAALVLMAGAIFAPHRLAGIVFEPMAPMAHAVLLVVAAAAVLVRRRYPRTAVAVALAVFILGIVVVGGPGLAYLIALGVTIFTIARLTDRRTTFLVAVPVVVVVVCCSWLVLRAEWLDPGVLLLAAVIGFAAAAGDASRSRREYIEAITERARIAEETRESEALRRVAEERLRIARDLHDAVAHQIAVINLNAGVASQALPTRPDDAQLALGTIRDASRAVLGEIGSLLATLRADEPGPEGLGSTLAPVPGLQGLDGMLSDFAASGLRVEVRRSGAPAALRADVDLVAFRIIQEALTNALKHGSDGSALLALDYTESSLDVAVANSVGGVRVGGPPIVGGHGLTGVRERVASVKGTFATHDGPGPVFRFEASLPLNRGGAA